MSKKYLPSRLTTALILVCLFAVLFSNSIFRQASFRVSANETAQTVPFTQNWTNPNLITVTDDWSSVPGIVGYRGDNLTAVTGVDPQTILVDGSATPVNVNANATDTAALSGGIYEFDQLPNPVVAMQGSGTADAPHLVINLNTSGTTALNIAYNLQDIDATADDAVQPFALQYRVGNTGNYTNIPAGFVADATTDRIRQHWSPRFRVDSAAGVENQPLVQLRIMTTNAVGNDELVGIDDINITGTGGGNVNLSGVGAANPNNVNAGATTLLTVTVTPANNPPSTGITVTGDLSTIGGAMSQPFFDNGTNGDVTPGDNIFSYLATVGANESGGLRESSGFDCRRAEPNSHATITLTVNAPPSASVHLTMGNPSGATQDVNNPTNYLLAKQQYVMSYHRDRGIANWVSWHLDSSLARNDAPTGRFSPRSVVSRRMVSGAVHRLLRFGI